MTSLGKINGGYMQTITEKKNHSKNGDVMCLSLHLWARLVSTSNLVGWLVVWEGTLSYDIFRI